MYGAEAALPENSQAPSGALIPEGGADAMPPVYTDGMLVVGDAAGLSNPIYREGSNLALISAKFAVQATIEAHKKGDFSAASMARYKDLLDASFIMDDLKTYSKTSKFFQSQPVFLQRYPEILTEAIHELLTVDSVPKRQKQRKILRQVLRRRKPWDLVRDAVGALRSVI